MESRLAMPDADVPASVDAAVGREGKLVLVLAEREGDPNRGVGLTVSCVMIRNNHINDISRHIRNIKSFLPYSKMTM